jgi:hypothetical protein
LLKHPTINKEEVFFEVTVGNGEEFDIYTVNRSSKENTGYLKVYVSNTGKVRVYFNDEDNIKFVKWKGDSTFKQQVREDEDEEEENYSECDSV